MILTYWQPISRLHCKSIVIGGSGIEDTIGGETGLGPHCGISGNLGLSCSTCCSTSFSE